MEAPEVEALEEARTRAVPVAARNPAAAEAVRAGRACPYQVEAGLEAAHIPEALEAARTRAVLEAARIPAAVVFSVL